MNQYKRIFIKITKIIGISSMAVLGIVLITITIIHMIDPYSYTDVFVGLKDKKDYGLYLSFEIGPFTRVIKIENLGSHLGNYGTLLWSPNKDKVAFDTYINLPDNWKRVRAIKVLDLRTFRVKTVIVTDSGVFRWIDNNTIRFFIGFWDGTARYKDVSVKSKTPLNLINIGYGEPGNNGWNFIALTDMDKMLDELKYK